MSPNALEISSQNQFVGLRESAQRQLELRNYSKPSLEERLATSGVEAEELLAVTERPEHWIPGFEIFPRRVFRQRHRGYFAELTRLTTGVVHHINLQPRQWASALMFAGTAKGFHVHPPYIPEGWDAGEWLARLFGPEGRIDDRPYDKEQWDLMFFLQGNVEIFLVDERAGMPRRKMRFLINGDDTPGAGNAGIVIPPGVTHALCCEGSRDLIMVYGTSTTFNPDFEGRIAASVEKADISRDWEQYFEGNDSASHFYP